jgi:hypothetical protein
LVINARWSRSVTARTYFKTKRDTGLQQNRCASSEISVEDSKQENARTTC